jgi:hypothetical protein
MEEYGKSSNRYKTLKLSMLMAGLSVLLFSKTFLAVIPAAGQEVEISVNAPEEVEAGESFDVTIDIRDVTDFNSGQFDLSFDSSVVEVTDVSEGSIDGETISELMWDFVDADTVRVLVLMPMGVGINGSGHLAEVYFKVKGEEGNKCVLDISNGSLFDIGGMWFDIDNEFKHELNNEIISDNLKEIFKAKGRPLENPTVKVIKKDELWKIIDRRVYGVKSRKGEIDILDRLEIIDTGEIVETEWVDAEIRVGEEKDEEEKFDIGPGTYPSISGRHEGTIEVYEDITVEKLYTYHSIGTGGHAEYVKIWNDSWSTEAAWSGYTGDWYNISFSEPFVLYAGEPYSYIIETGSYPQIIHKQNHTALYNRGVISCDKFVDANGRTYNDWIPAIKLW